MSSALAAFAQTKQAEPTPAEVEHDAYASDQDGAHVATSQPPSTLAAFANAQEQDAQPVKKIVTLVDVANESPQQPPAASVKPSLMDVARNLDHQKHRETSNQLRMLAAEVQAEEHDTAQRRAQEIARELTTTSQQVKHEQQLKRHIQIAQALKEATQEEPAYNPTDDAVKHDEEASVKRAVERVVEVAIAPQRDKPAARKSLQATLSVDRHVLKQRQHRHGLESKSTTKAKTLKDKLSTFQFDQLSITQQRVFLAMLVDDKNTDNSSRKKRCNMHAIEELAKDRATQLRQKHKLLKTKPLQYAKLDDTRHCRFRPKLKAVDHGGRGRDDDDHDDDDGGGGDNQRREDFIRRMEATERVRKEQLRRTRAERDYLAQIDKKECPQCGNPQSYAELTQKRKKCPNCGVPYKSRLAWGEIADEFLARMASHLQSQLDRPTEKNIHDNQQHALQRRPGKRWHDVRDEFLGRVQLDLQQREMTKELILHELEAQCTFAPQISERARRLQLGDFEGRLRRDLENRRIRQEQYRLLSAAIAKAEASSKQQKAAPRGELPRAFAERLQKDLQQRRDRLAANENPKLHMNGSSGRSRGLY